MDLTFARCAHAHDKKLHLIVGLQPWLDAIKELDIDLQAEHTEHHAELEVMMKSLHLKVIDVNSHTAVDKQNQFDLLHPTPPTKETVRTKLQFNYKNHKIILNLHAALLGKISPAPQWNEN